MKIKIGDKVKINKKKVNLDSYNNTSSWYSDEIYTIKDFDKKCNIATLDRNLHHRNDCRIHILYLKSLKKERKKKLLKLNSL
jgi:hypothetical protein